MIGDADSLVTPGYVNAHQHLTGDRLVHSCIPDAIDSQEAIFGWAVPVHAAHTGDDDELSATLGAIEAVTNGITCTVEAGTVAHPDRVAAAVAFGGHAGDDRSVGLGRRRRAVRRAGRRGARAARATLLDRLPPGGLVEGWVTLVGHDLMSDELVAGASELARDRGVGPHVPHVAARRRSGQLPARTGRRPFVHLDELGVLGPHVLVAHAVHLDDDELDVVVRTDTAVASCPWAYLRLAQGFTVAGRHGELLARGARIALGCDAENAGDAVDILRAAAAVRRSGPRPCRSTRSASRPTTGLRWPRSAAHERSARATRSVRSRWASRPTSSCTIGAARSSCRAAPIRCCS